MFGFASPDTRRFLYLRMKKEIRFKGFEGFLWVGWFLGTPPPVQTVARKNGERMHRLWRYSEGMNRRNLFGALAALAATAALDPERLLWVPGRKLISIPAPMLPPSPLRLYAELPCPIDKIFNVSKRLFVIGSQTLFEVFPDGSYSALNARVGANRVDMLEFSATRREYNVRIAQ